MLYEYDGRVYCDTLLYCCLAFKQNRGLREMKIKSNFDEIIHFILNVYYSIDVVMINILYSKTMLIFLYDIKTKGRTRLLKSDFNTLINNFED